MAELRTAAQAVLSDFDGFWRVRPKTIDALRAALNSAAQQADEEQPVGFIRPDTVPGRYVFVNFYEGRNGAFVWEPVYRTARGVAEAPMKDSPSSEAKQPNKQGAAMSQPHQSEETTMKTVGGETASRGDLTSAHLTAESLAALLNGREYRREMTKEEEAQAKACGLVVAFGASDDLLEFRGAVDDEIGAYEGTTARVTSSGVLPAWEDMDKDEERDVEMYFRLKRHARDVVAKWDTDGYSWVITSDIPHSTFDIVEDGEPYCKGIVFAVSHLTGA